MPVMSAHAKFEELCALAVSGQLRGEEWAEFDEHSRACQKCRTLRRAFEETYVKLSGSKVATDRAHLPEGMTQRIEARARSAGIPLAIQPNTRDKRGVLWSWRFPFKSKSTVWVPVVAVLVLVSFLLGVEYQTTHHSPEAPSVVTSQKLPPSAATPPNDESIRLTDQLQEARNQLAAAEGKLKQRQEERTLLLAQVAEFKQSIAELQKDESKQKDRVEELESHLEKLQTRENAARIASLASEEEVKGLREEVLKLNTQLRLARELDTTLREAYDLIVDRNVHVLNVLTEVTDDARSARARGRIFYVEGKKLVFYAYDLTHKIHDEPAFYVWGQTLNTVQQVVSLGKFQVDSEQQGRWVLKVTDPRLLANIDSVFVTEESYKKAITQPSGKRMLFRVLDEKANDQ
jgi:hypothetical protein